MEDCPMASANACMNQKILDDLRQIVNNDPEANLLSVIPLDYRSRHVEQSEHPAEEEISEAAKLNRKTMEKLQKKLIRRPEMNLYQNFPRHYTSNMEAVQRVRKEMEEDTSEAAKLNRKTVEQLRKALVRRPEMNLYKDFPRHYVSDMEAAQRARKEAEELPTDIPDKWPGFFEMLETYRKAIVVHKLSETVMKLLGLTDNPAPSASRLCSAVIRLLKSSELLYEFPARGVVVKCNDEIVVKAIRSGNELAEYTSLQYLEQHLADIPVPRPKGLVQIGPLKIIFMTYIPSTTLAAVWHRLSSLQKSSIQSELELILQRLRMLSKPDEQELGALTGEGVKYTRGWYITEAKGIRTCAEYNEFVIASVTAATPVSVAVLRSCLPRNDEHAVFTHGDIRPQNVMVDVDAKGQWSVSGIIDWEDSGFYPSHVECTSATDNLFLPNESDWYLYLPTSIQPSQYPVWWLFDLQLKRMLLHS